MYVLAPNQIVEKFPYLIGDLRKDNPQVSFPKIPSLEMLASYNIYPVVSTGATYDSATQVATQEGCAYTGSRWETSWKVRSKTAEELAAEAQAAADLVIQEDAKAEPLIAYLVSHTAAEIKAKVNADITDLASAKIMFGRFGVALAYLARQGLR